MGIPAVRSILGTYIRRERGSERKSSLMAGTHITVMQDDTEDMLEGYR